PGTAPLLHLLAEAKASLGETEPALAEWERAATAEPWWSVPPRRSAEVLSVTGRHELAVDRARRALAAWPDDARCAAALASAWLAGADDGHVADVGGLKDLVDRLGERLPGDVTVAVLRISLAAREPGPTGRAAAITQARALAADTRTGAPALLELARVSRRYALGLEDEFVAAAEAKAPRSAALVAARAAGAIEAGDAAAAVRAISSALGRSGGPATSPSSADGALRRLRIQAMSADAAGDRIGQFDLVYGTATDLAGDPIAQAAVVDWAVAAGFTELALESAERVHRATGDWGVRWRELRARALLSRGTAEATTEALKLLGESAGVAPANLSGRLLEARAAELAGDLKRWEATVAAARKIAPASPDVDLAQARLDVATAHRDAAVQGLTKLAAAAANYPRGVSVRVAAARALIEIGGYREAIKALEVSVGDDGTPPARRVERELLRGLALARLGKADDAKRCADGLLAAADARADAVRAAARLLATIGRADESAAAVARLKQLGGRDAQLRAEADLARAASASAVAAAAYEELVRAVPGDR
ncbi:MAG TPA: hypothetical protein VF796_25260, partial [Humisphaera sp.]